MLLYKDRPIEQEEILSSVLDDDDSFDDDDLTIDSQDFITICQN